MMDDEYIFIGCIDSWNVGWDFFRATILDHDLKQTPLGLMLLMCFHQLLGHVIHAS